MSKLPKWAQSHIDNLTRRVAHLEEEAQHGAADSTAFLDPYDVRRPLGSDARVEFVLAPAERRADSRWLNAHVVRRIDRMGGHQLEIMGSDRLVIRSQSSNVITIGVDDR